MNSKSDCRPAPGSLCPIILKLILTTKDFLEFRTTYLFSIMHHLKTVYPFEVVFVPIFREINLYRITRREKNEFEEVFEVYQ
jgi:hypothetical protein